MSLDRSHDLLCDQLKIWPISHMDLSPKSTVGKTKLVSVVASLNSTDTGLTMPVPSI